MTGKVNALRTHDKAEEARIAERRRKVGANLLSGLSYRQIASALEVSAATIASDVKAILAELHEDAKEDVDRHRALELARLDRAQNAIWNDVTNGRLEAIDRFLKISDRRARLLGMDKPIKIAHTDTEGQDAAPPLSLDEAAQQLAAIFERAKARIADPALENEPDAPPLLIEGEATLLPQPPYVPEVRP
jgi:hypothetical protein